MRRPHGIDVELLEEADVLDHRLDGNILGGLLAVLMAIDALDQNRLAIDQVPPALDFDLPESDVLRDRLDDSARSIFGGHEQAIEVRILGRPLMNVRDGNGQLGGRLAAGTDFHGLRVNSISVGATRQRRCNRHLCGFVRGVRHLGFDLQRSVPIGLVEIGVDFEIAHVHVCGRPEVHVAIDAAHAPHVLIFQKRAVAEPVNLDGQ